MKSLITLPLTLLAFAAWAQTPSSPGTGATTPTQACNQLVEAAKADNFEAVMNLTVRPPQAKAKKQDKMIEKKFDKMSQSYLSDIQTMNCGNENVVQDHATVTAQTKDGQRLIPFVQQDGQWKFDMRAYKAFYNIDSKAKKGKKM